MASLEDIQISALEGRISDLEGQVAASVGIEDWDSYFDDDDGPVGPFHLTKEDTDEVKVGEGLISLASVAVIKEWPGVITDTVSVSGTGTVYIWFAIEVNAANGTATGTAYDLRSGTSLPTLNETTHYEILGAVHLTAHQIKGITQYKHDNIYVPVSVFKEESVWGTERLYYAGLFVGGSRGIPYAKAQSIDGSTDLALGDKAG
jgi:hypothetical protein